MQAILRFIPYDALRSVDDLRLDLLAPVHGQTVHENRIGLRSGHHRAVDSPVFKVAPPFGALRLETHARAHIGRDEISTAAGIHGVGERSHVVELADAYPVWVDFVARRGRHVNVESEDRCGLQPCTANVVGIAYPSHRFALHRAAMLDVGINVGENLARVILVGQAVDHWHARIRREALDNDLLESADHHYVDHARYHPGDILDGLAA